MISVRQQQEIADAVDSYFFVSSKQSEPPPILKDLLQESARPLDQLRHLYKPLRQSSAIPSRAKLEILLDCFERLAQQPALSTLIDQIAAEEESLSESFVQSMLRFPRMLANYRHTSIVPQIYSKVIEGLPQLPLVAQLEALNILVILRETRLLLENAAALKIASTHLLQLRNSHALVVYALVSKNQPALSQLTASLNEPELIKLLVDHVLFLENLSPSTSSIIYDLCCRRLTPAGIISIFKTVLFQWSNPSFPKMRSPNSQKMLSNFLSQMVAKADINSSDVVQAINEGISYRFEYFEKERFVCQSAVIVLKQYACKLGIVDNKDGQFDFKQFDELCTFDRFEDAVVQQLVLEPSLPINQTSNSQQTSESSSKAEFLASQPAEVNTPVQSDELAFRPKNLYDCYLGLTSDSSARNKYCLKFAERLIREQCGDLVFVWRNLLSVLLTLKDQEGSTEFAQQRKQTLIALIIYRPVDVVEGICNHFYKDCALADKLSIMELMATALRQLADNPSKYALPEEDQEQQFYFRKIASKYNRAINQTKIDAQLKRSEQLQEKSRRWGHTRILFNKSKASGELKPMSRQELIISEESKPYLSRLYAVVDQIFFRFVLPLRNCPKELKDTIYSCGVLDLLSEFAHNISTCWMYAENYHGKYNIIDEILDLHDMITVRDIAVQRKKLSLLLKVSTAVDSNLSQHELVLAKLMRIVRAYQDDKYPWFDPSIRMLVQLLTENLRKTLTSFGFYPTDT